MKNKKILVGLLVVLVLGIFAYWFYQDDIGSHGRLYPSKSKMCEQFAESYLRTMKERENISDFSGDAWLMAIDVETEINKLCQLELTPEALKNYKPTALEKYQQE